MTNNSVRVQSPSQPVSSQALSPVACAAATGNKSPPSKLGILSHLFAYSFLSPLKACLDLGCLAIIHLLFKAQVQCPLPETLTSISVAIAAPSLFHTTLKRWVCAFTPWCPLLLGGWGLLCCCLIQVLHQEHEKYSIRICSLEWITVQ